AWMYAVIGGIDLDPAEPGYRHIMMQPKPGGGLTSAKAELHSPFGLISSHWKFDNHVFEWKINIPANSYATVTIPARSSARIYEQGKPVDEGSGIGLVRREAGQAVYKITSGEYHFTVE
ncbi:MAG: alpha-L-rhamnosidase, partial [Chloroflexota bacterium]|nr:alpha-L-rhamnosidase [Chloroflexota bacterium]